MKTGERGKRKDLSSSSLQPLISSFLFIFLLYSNSLSAIDINRPTVGVSSGVTIDFVPFGIEQVYFAAQGVYTLPGALAFSLRPSISLNNSSKMVRIPLVVNLSMNIDKKDIFLLSGYLGGGLEVYRSAANNTNSFLFTGGITLAAGSFYIDIPIVRTYRAYNTDSDISVTAGFYFQR